jgi:hypothetical protein
MWHCPILPAALIGFAWINLCVTCAAALRDAVTGKNNEIIPTALIIDLYPISFGD